MNIRRRLDDNCIARAVDADKRTVRFLAQSTALGSDNLVILPKAGERRLKEFMVNPIVVPSHMRTSMEGDPIVVGSVYETEFAKDGMLQTVTFADTDMAEQYWRLYRDGHMRAVSIAWDRDDVQERLPAGMQKLLDDNEIRLGVGQFAKLQGVVKEYRQRDLSLVAIGADPKALARELGEEEARRIVAVSFDDPQSIEHIRGVIAYEKQPLADIMMAWDAGKQIKGATPEQLKAMCAWFNSDFPDVASSYKLPHHMREGYKTCWKGVAAAMVATLGGRGGLKGVSEADRKGIYGHLAKHYADFEKTAPSFRAFEGEELERMMMAFGVTEHEIVDSVREPWDLAILDTVPDGVEDNFYADLLQREEKPAPLAGGEDDALMGELLKFKETEK